MRMYSGHVVPNMRMSCGHLDPNMRMYSGHEGPNMGMYCAHVGADIYQCFVRIFFQECESTVGMCVQARELQ